MRSNDSATPSDQKLKRLIAFLGQDPTNTGLLADAITEAFDIDALETASQLLQRYGELAPLPPELANIRGIIALREQHYADAANAFQQVVTASGGDAAVRFNLAWSKAMMQDYAGAAELLDDSVTAVSPRGPALKIQMLHHLGLLDDALSCGQGLAECYPDNSELMGALAVVALDLEDVDLAKFYASRAGNNQDGLSTLGTLLLNEQKVDAALAAFERAIDASANNPRAWVGKGLGLLSKSDNAAAAECLDRGAALFKDHIGSWIAAGWAYFAKGDYATSRARFETALAIDDNFAESHGALAVLDILENHLEDAKRRTDIALRLDRVCFSGALAKSLLLESRGQTGLAQKIRERALTHPIGKAGQTIAQALIGFGRNPPPGKR